MEIWQKVSGAALKLFARGQEIALKRAYSCRHKIRIRTYPRGSDVNRRNSPRLFPLLAGEFIQGEDRAGQSRRI